MSKFALPAQKIVFDALSGNISATVYDDVPDLPPGDPAANFPYVVMANDISEPLDTDSWVGETVTIELNIWSRYNGSKEAKTIQAEIYDLLHRQPLTLAGVDVVDCLHTYSGIREIGSGNYVHGISRYTLKLTEVI